MKNTIKNIFGYAFLPAIALLAGALSLQSCTGDDAGKEELYFRLIGGQDLFEYDSGAHSTTMEIFSNMGYWVIEPEFSEDAEWIDPWPYEGSNDGRFTLNILENTTPFTRFATINFVVGRTVMASIKVSQKSSDPYLKLGLGGTTMTSPSSESKLVIPLDTNVGWKAELVSSASWIQLDEETEDSQAIRVSENTGDTERTADIRFTAIGTGLENVTATVTIKQFDKSKDPYNGQKKSVAEIMDILNNAPGKISENYYTEVFVTSDRDNLNVLPNQMFVQDESGRGMLVEFSAASENTFALNTSLGIHLYDSEFVRDTDSDDIVARGLKLVNFAANQIFENNGISETAPEPVQVASLQYLADNLADYENTLVTLPAVEFCLPFGCYANIDEGNAKGKEIDWTIDSSNDGPKLYGHLVRDAGGKAIKVISRTTFLQRFSEVMRQGSGTLTGIVTEYAKYGVTEPCVFIRNTDDNKVSGNESDRLTNTLVNFGPLVGRPDLAKVMASTGTAQLKTTCYEAAVGSGGQAITYAYTYSRREPGTITVNPLTGEQTASPVLVNTPLATAIQYQFTCLEQTSFYAYTGSTMNRTGMDADDKHEAWVLNIDDFAAANDIYLTFTMSGSYRSPKAWILEWALNESDPVASYKTISTFDIPYWSCSYHLQQFSLKLPDELKSQRKFTLRMRSTGTEGAGGADINNTASVRTGMIRIVEMK